MFFVCLLVPPNKCSSNNATSKVALDNYFQGKGKEGEGHTVSGADRVCWGGGSGETWVGMEGLAVDLNS